MSISKNLKPKLFSLGLLVFFLAFVVYLLYPSDLSVVSKELKIASSLEEVKSIWDKNKVNLEYNPDFYTKIISKLETLNLKDEDVLYVYTWLPDRRETNTNLVIVPDLSARINQENNNPEQIKNDKILLQTIWKNFQNKNNSKVDSKSSFLVTVTDDNQVRGDFYKIAKELSLDLENKKENIRVRDVLQSVDKNFQANLDNMYKLAKEKTSGANFWYFFDRKLENYYKKSTLTDKYENKLIIITDGYLELTDGTVYTQNTAGIGAKIKQGMTLDQAMQMYGTTISTTSYKNLNNWNILMLEINERKSGAGSDFAILKKYWLDWYKTMGLVDIDKQVQFIQRDNTTQVAENKIVEFLK